MIYFILFFPSVCLTPEFDYAELKRYDDLPKQTWAISDPEHSARVILVPLFSRFGPILRTFQPLLSQCSPSSGHLDPLTIPLSLFKESKAVLDMTIIFFKDTSCFIFCSEKHFSFIGKVWFRQAMLSWDGFYFFFVTNALFLFASLAVDIFHPMCENYLPHLLFFVVIFFTRCAIALTDGHIFFITGDNLSDGRNEMLNHTKRFQDVSPLEHFGLGQFVWDKIHIIFQSDLVWCLFYGPSTHFRSFWARSVTLSTLFPGKPPRQFTST